MAIDYDTVRANAQRPAPGSDWDAKEAAMVAEYRVELARRREQEAHQADVRAYARFATDKAEQARKRGNRGDDRAALVWSQAAANIDGGKWTVDPIVSSDPAIVAHQALRTRLAYAGEMVQFTDK